MKNITLLLLITLFSTLNGDVIIGLGGAIRGPLNRPIGVSEITIKKYSNDAQPIVHEMETNLDGYFYIQDFIQATTVSTNESPITSNRTITYKNNIIADNIKTARLYNSNGQFVQNANVSKLGLYSIAQFDFNPLSSGVYFAQIVDQNGKVSSSKLINVDDYNHNIPSSILNNFSKGGYRNLKCYPNAKDDPQYNVGDTVHVKMVMYNWKHGYDSTFFDIVIPAESEIITHDHNFPDLPQVKDIHFNIHHGHEQDYNGLSTGDPVPNTHLTLKDTLGNYISDLIVDFEGNGVFEDVPTDNHYFIYTEPDEGLYPEYMPFSFKVIVNPQETYLDTVSKDNNTQWVEMGFPGDIYRWDIGLLLHPNSFKIKEEGEYTKPPVDDMTLAELFEGHLPPGITHYGNVGINPAFAKGEVLKVYANSTEAKEAFKVGYREIQKKLYGEKEEDLVGDGILDYLEFLEQGIDHSQYAGFNLWQQAYPGFNVSMGSNQTTPAQTQMDESYDSGKTTVNYGATMSFTGSNTVPHEVENTKMRTGVNTYSSVANADANPISERDRVFSQYMRDWDGAFIEGSNDLRKREIVNLISKKFKPNPVYNTSSVGRVGR